MTTSLQGGAAPAPRHRRPSATRSRPLDRLLRAGTGGSRGAIRPSRRDRAGGASIAWRIRARDSGSRGRAASGRTGRRDGTQSTGGARSVLGCARFRGVGGSLPPAAAAARLGTEVRRVADEVVRRGPDSGFCARCPDRSRGPSRAKRSRRCWQPAKGSGISRAGALGWFTRFRTGPPCHIFFTVVSRKVTAVPSQ